MLSYNVQRLSAPGFDDSFDLWAGPVFAMLESCVGAIQAEEIVGVVCFHPRCESVAAERVAI